MKVSPRRGSILFWKLSQRSRAGLHNFAPSALGTWIFVGVSAMFDRFSGGGKSLRLMVDSWIYVLKSRPYTPWPAELHSSSRASLTSFSRKSRWTRSRSSVASDARSAFLKTKPVAGNQVLTPAFGTKPVPARNDSCASSRMLKRSCVHPDRVRRWCGFFIPNCSRKVR